MIASVALDLGTTSIKAGLLDRDGTLGHIVTLPAPPITVSDGCYESDALAYAEAAEQVLGECTAHAGSHPPLGLCSQRSSFLIWDRASSQPLTPLISWQDNRGMSSCEALHAQEGLIRDLTGLRLTPYYFAPKLRAVLQDHPQWRARLERGELLAGTLDTFLVWRWTGGKHHVTDASMAARTLLMDIRQQQWSPALCDLFGVPLCILPQIRPSAAMNLQLDNGLNLQASAGDQSAALIAGVGDDSREALVNLGTGGFVVRYLPQEKTGLEGYLRTLVYQDKNQHSHVAIEGTLNSIAAALAPYPVGECRIEDLFSGEIFCLAEPSGIGAPYFASSRFAACLPDPLHSDLGICFSQSVEHLTPHQIACLLLEGIIFRVARILEDFHRESALERVYLSGGLSELACIQQGIAQCVPFAVYRLRQKDSSLQGAALLAAGMTAAYRREAEKIPVEKNIKSLVEKYRRWKDWLDGLLDS